MTRLQNAKRKYRERREYEKIDKVNFFDVLYFYNPWESIDELLNVRQVNVKVFYWDFMWLKKLCIRVMYKFFVSSDPTTFFH